MFMSIYTNQSMNHYPYSELLYHFFLHSPFSQLRALKEFLLLALLPPFSVKEDFAISFTLITI